MSVLKRLLILAALVFYCDGRTFMDKAFECTQPICFGSSGFIHHRPEATTTSDEAPFKEWSVIESSAELTNILIKFRVPEVRSADPEDHFVILASSKHHWSDHSYVSIDTNDEKVVLFADVTDVTIVATKETEFYLEYYSRCVAVDRQSVTSDENLLRSLKTDVPEDFQNELCWVVLPDRATKVYESGGVTSDTADVTSDKMDITSDTKDLTSDSGDAAQLSFSTFNDVKDEDSVNVLNAYLEQAMSTKDKHCLEMEITNLECYLNLTESLSDKCKSNENKHCDEVDKMLMQSSLEVAASDTTEVRNGQKQRQTNILMNLHPVRTKKMWRYLFRSDCDNLRTALFDKRSSFRNNYYYGNQNSMQLLRLRYMCNEKFDCRAFGACRTTCRFVRSLKSVKDTIGFDVCNPHQAKAHLSMF